MRLYKIIDNGVCWVLAENIHDAIDGWRYFLDECVPEDSEPAHISIVEGDVIYVKADEALKEGLGD